MGLFSFGTKMPIKKTLRLKRLKTSFEVKEGQNLKLWLDNKNNLVNVYAKGSGGGRGLLATIDDNSIVKSMRKKNVDFETDVKTVTDTYFDLFVHMYEF